MGQIISEAERKLLVETRAKLPKSIFIKDLKSRDSVQSSFLVKSKQIPLSKNGKPYLSMYLMDKTGEIDTRLWENAEQISQTFLEGDIIAVSGRVHSFQNRLQMIIQQLTPVPAQQVELKDYLPKSDLDLEALYERLIKTFEGLENLWIKRLGLDLLTDVEISERYKLCPAAKTIHHAYLGGLLVHSLQLVDLIDAVLPFYEAIDRDKMIFGAVFHDFGKIYELDYKGNFGYTDEGRLVGHITIGTNLVDRKIQKIDGFPRELEWELKHLILSHHGRLEYGSPKRPHTIEAEVLHHLDNMDSKINSIQHFMQADRAQARWTGHHKAYDQYYYRPDCYIQGNESDNGEPCQS